MTTKEIDRTEIETAIWELTGCAVDQRRLHSVMRLVDRYRGTTAPDPLSGAQAEADQTIQAAKDEAARILEAAEAQAAALKPVDLTGVTIEGYRDAEGALWVRLGVLPEAATEDLGAPRTCRDCGRIKVLSEFRTNGKGTASRRRQCKECENRIRREKDAAKRTETDRIQP